LGLGLVLARTVVKKRVPENSISVDTGNSGYWKISQSSQVYGLHSNFALEKELTSYHLLPHSHPKMMSPVTILRMKLLSEFGLL
jgi:hypothetical protein